ncbi:MAG TPA: GNAT family N-acetyltransferase [Kribbellaceae bacterium]|nr:GNAT family N-acetyltransferase [Kribbellaceae bacterium]
MAEVFSSARLLARPWSAVQDAEAAYAIYSSPEVTRYLGSMPEPMTSPEQAGARLAGWSVPDDDPAYGVWAVQPRDGEQPIGTVFVRPLPPANVDVEIGWHLGTQHWGHGYATEIGRAAAAYAFGKGLSEVYAVIRPGNQRSEAVAKRLGMQYVGRTDKYYGMELEVYRLRPSDLRPVERWP